MSKKGILVLILVVLAVGVTVLWFALPKTVVFEDPDQETTGFTPLGQGRPDGQQTGQDTTQTLSPDTDSQSSVSALTVIGRLTKIANKPVAGFTTLQKTVEIQQEEAQSQEPEQYNVASFPTLQLGDDREEVAIIKNILNQQENSPDLPETTDFDVSMKNAVIAFQEANNLQPDGVIGPKTRQAINVFQGYEPPEEIAPEFITQNLVRYMDRETGHVFDYDRQNKSVTRISSTNIPRVHHAFWSADGSAVIVQLLDALGTTVRTFKGTLENGTLDGEFLQDNLGFVAVSPVDDRFIVLDENGQYTEGLVGSFDSNRLDRAFRSSYGEWLPQWGKGDTIMLTTLASGFAPGYVFETKTNNDNFEDVLANKLGLTTNTNTATGDMLYSENNPETGRPQLFLYSVTDKTSQNLGLNTLAEKCTWHPEQTNLIFCGVATSLPAGIYPDDWYQGRMTISDNIWIINTDTLQTNQIINIGQEAGVSVDIINPHVDAAGEHLMFTDKNNLHLWEAKLPLFQ